MRKTTKRTGYVLTAHFLLKIMRPWISFHQQVFFLNKNQGPKASGVIHVGDILVAMSDTYTMNNAKNSYLFYIDTQDE